MHEVLQPTDLQDIHPGNEQPGVPALAGGLDWMICRDPLQTQTLHDSVISRDQLKP